MIIQVDQNTPSANVVDVSGNTYDVSSNLLVNVANLPLNTPPPNLPSSNTVRVSVDSWTTGNSIPVVIDTDGNTIKIDQTNNGVKVNPTAVLAVRTQGLGNTALAVGGPGIVYGVSMINKSAAVGVWIKFYASATAPTSSDTPFLIQYLENVAQYNLISHNDSFYNMPVVDVFWVRATLLSADNDDTDTGVDCEVTTFVGGL